MFDKLYKKKTKMENQDNNSNEMNQNELDNNEGQDQTEENDFMYIYEWVDSIQLSRPKKNIARDFCDCVLVAEIIKHYLPRLVDLHNYPSASSTMQKTTNWNTLNTKVLKKIGVRMSKQEINDVITCKPLAIEHLLQRIYDAIQNQINGNNNEEGNMNNNNMVGASNGNVERLKKILEEKESNINQLHEIIDVLEMKLRSSSEMQETLANKVEELTNLLQSKGIAV